MSPTTLWIASGAVAAIAAYALYSKRRFGALALALIVSAILLAIRGPDPKVIAPFTLLYLSSLLALPNWGAVTHGLAGIALVVFTFTTHDETVDWSKKARDLFNSGKYTEANLAYDKARAEDPEDLQLAEFQGYTAWSLGMHQKAIEHLSFATDGWRRRMLDADEKWSKSPQDAALLQKLSEVLSAYTNCLRNKTLWMLVLGNGQEAIAELDRAMQHRLLATHGTLVFSAANLRVMYVDYLIDGNAGFGLVGLRALLEQNHPDRVGVSKRLAEHLRSPTPKSEARRILVEGLSSERMRQEVDKKLDTAWTLLQEADIKLGDIRTTDVNRILEARLTRAEIDLRLGRFLRAKEELQTLLATPQPPNERRVALEFLAKLTEEAGAAYESALYRKELITANGGEAAPLPVKADYFEALFFAGEAQPELSKMFMEEADAHLDPTKRRPEGRSYFDLDFRTVGYRGVAALRYENDPVRALSYLRVVYDALRSNRTKDPSILQPARAKLFVESMLEASAKSNRPEDRADGILFANALLEVSSNDSDLRKRRAELYEKAGRFSEAAEDLKVALRHSPLDDDLFQHWIDVSEQVKDTSGRSPHDIAVEATKNAFAKLAELRAELDRQAGYQSTNKLRQSPKYLTKAFAQIFELESSLATDPLMAWHLSQEFGRIGETDEARNFLFKAVSTEPDILSLRMRLGELRLDLGLYQEAARDFREILSRDPANTEVALRAFEALELSGQLDEARALRRDLVAAAPATAGMEFSIRECLDSHHVDRAIQILGPHLGSKDPRIAALTGLVRLADGKYDAAVGTLGSAIAASPNAPDLHRALLVAMAHTNADAELLKEANRFVKLPRLLPIDDVNALLDELTTLGKYSIVGVIADAIHPRYPGESDSNLEARGMLGKFLAGDAGPLRDLLANPDRARRMRNDVVAAAFGIALKEKGAADAARFLQSAREYTDERDWAALPLAAAFALTPHTQDVATFLGRYEHRMKDVAIPLSDQAMWWMARQRSGRSIDAPPTEPGAEGELSWLATEARTQKIGEDSIDEAYLRFLLYRFAGRGFEADARALAEKIVNADRKALTAARYIADEIEKKDGATAAAAYLADKYQAIPGDLETFRQLGRLLDATDKDANVLFDLAQNGKTLFPNSDEPFRLAAIAALRKKEYAEAVKDLETVLTKDPKNERALKVLADVARAANDAEIVAHTVSRIQASGSADPAILAFLVQRCNQPNTDKPTIVTTIGPLLAIQPKFYSGAALLAGALAELGQKDALKQLATKLIEILPNDPDAEGRGDDFAPVVSAVDKSGDAKLALQLADVAILVDPSHSQLRRLRVDLSRRLKGDAAGIPDLELLCTLSPRESELLFTYGDLLLQGRGDKIDTVLRVMPLLKQLAPDDSRFLDMFAKLHFLRPRHTRPKSADATPLSQIREGLNQVKIDIAQALKQRSGRQEYWYFAGVISFLLDDPEYAKLAFSKCSEGFRLAPRVRYLRELLETKSGLP